jgi:hypothetical protein
VLPDDRRLPADEIRKRSGGERLRVGGERGGGARDDERRGQREAPTTLTENDAARVWIGGD